MQHQPKPLTNPRYLILDAELTCAAVVVFLGAIRGFSVPVIHVRYGLRWPAMSPLTFAMAAATMVLLAVGAVSFGSVLEKRHWLPTILPPTYYRELQEAMKHASLSTRVALALAQGVFPGLSEALLFRGQVQRGLLANWPPLPAIVVTSALFALWHVEPVHMITTFAFSCLIGWIAWRCDSIVPGMGLHAFNNCLFGLIGVAASLFPDTKDAEAKFPEAGMLVVAVLGLASAALCLRVLARKLPAAPARIRSEAPTEPIPAPGE